MLRIDQAWNMYAMSWSLQTSSSQGDGDLHQFISAIDVYVSCQLIKGGIRGDLSLLMRKN